ncbi:MAG TPA: hypothetical protein DCM64_09380 [Gammaproteobacteria bacterium]|jgi:hypothetical protein|nr:hypothetical protein [Gammaproteobacteria bacterium]
MFCDDSFRLLLAQRPGFRFAYTPTSLMAGESTIPLNRALFLLQLLLLVLEGKTERLMVLALP